MITGDIEFVPLGEELSPEERANANSKLWEALQKGLGKLEENPFSELNLTLIKSPPGVLILEFKLQAPSFVAADDALRNLLQASGARFKEESEILEGFETGSYGLSGTVDR